MFIQQQVLLTFFFKKQSNVELIEFNIEKTNKSSLFKRSIIGPASITIEEFVKKYFKAMMAGAERLELTTYGFGDRRSTN